MTCTYHFRNVQNDLLLLIVMNYLSVILIKAVRTGIQIQNEKREKAKISWTRSVEMSWLKRYMGNLDIGLVKYEP